MRNYSVDNLDVAWLGLDFAEGLADGTFAQEVRAVASFTVKPTARGKLTRTFNPQKHGTIAFTVDQESQLHQDLIVIAEADRDPNQRDKVDNMTMREPGSSVIHYENAFILTEPDESRGMEATTFVWVFAFEKKQPEPQTTLDNLVGN